MKHSTGKSILLLFSRSTTASNIYLVDFYTTGTDKKYVLHAAFTKYLTGTPERISAIPDLQLIVKPLKLLLAVVSIL